MSHQTSTKVEALCPRSILFVPADQPEIVIKALRSQADAVCLDLEDAVAPRNKVAARNNLPDLLAQAVEHHKPVWIRVNSDLLNVAEDINALPKGQAVGAASIVVPKVQGWSQLQWIDEALASRFEADAKPSMVAMFEDVATIHHFLSSTAPTTIKLAALALGTEDLSSDLGVKPNPQLLNLVLYDLVKLGRKLDVPVLGFPDSIAIITDTALLKDSVIRAQQIGSSGAFCIHPKQLDTVNRGFMPSAEEIAWAEATMTLEPLIDAEGVGVHPTTKRMVDPPVIDQARAILARDAAASLISA